MPDWQLFDLVLLISLAPLVVVSAFFSGSETALFGMPQNERLRLASTGSLTARSVEALLAAPRMLLITILLGNMVANVLYFVISSVLMLRHSVNVAASVALALGSLLLLVLLGEVFPKMLANSRRTTFTGLFATPLLAVHRTIGPLRIILDRIVVAPLSRLTAPRTEPHRLDEDELHALLELSGREHAIDASEQRMLREVIGLSRMRVRDVMTPRVRIHAIPLGAERAEVLALLEIERLTKYPVYEGDLDHVVGFLRTRDFLLSDHPTVTRDLPELTVSRFVPDMASLEQLLDHFRNTEVKSSIVVDEFGGTAGIVSIEDVVEEIVGDIAGEDEPVGQGLRLIGFSTWLAPGDLNLGTLADAFDHDFDDVQASTIGGLILERLGRPAARGDEIVEGELTLTVKAVEGPRVTEVVITMRHQPTDDAAQAEPSNGGDS